MTTRSSAEIRGEIASVRREISRLQWEADQIKQSIAADWRADNSTLASKLAAIPPRISGAELTIRHLEGELSIALKIEGESAFLTQLRATQAAYSKANDLNTKIEKAYEALKALEAQRAELLNEGDRQYKTLTHVHEQAFANGAQVVLPDRRSFLR